jgi:PAS domain S-box-containing protein
MSGGRPEQQGRVGWGRVMAGGANGWWAAGAAGLAWLGAAVLPRVRRRLRPSPPPPPAKPPQAVLPGAQQPLAADLFSAFDMGAAILRTPEGAILHWSAGCERLFGIPASEALGRTAHELLGTRFPDGGRRKLVEELNKTGEWQGELRHKRRNGGHVVVASHWILRRDPADGRPAAVLELHTDATALKAAEAALRAGEARLRLAQEVAGVGTWEWDPEDDSFVWSPEHYALFGLSPAAGEPDSLESFLALVHPEDRAAVRAAAHEALASGEYLAEFRIVRPGRNGGEETAWLIGRGRRMPSPAGRVGPILGVNVDITARKEAEERQLLLMREVDHRAKNALAVVQAVLRLTRAETMPEFARAVEGRVAALARAQTLLTESRRTGADFQAMLRGELAPFAGKGSGAQVLLDGPLVLLAPLTAQPLSMALHELATNAAKHGSLSVPGGTLALSWREDRPGARLRLRWEESGGPLVAGPPRRRGFGSRVIENTVRDQLRGDVSFAWTPAGLVCEIDIPLHGAPQGAAAEA